MGADSWSEITTWRDWERLLTMTSHIVVTRPGYDVSNEHVGAILRDRIVDLRGVDNDAGRIQQLSGARIYFTDVVNKDISATEIRHVAKEGRFDDLSKLVPQPVAEYIKKYGIYRDLHEA
jgi:nicotinate-nucleotide adenylyltransferase